jgi:hypothetical protein
MDEIEKQEPMPQGPTNNIFPFPRRPWVYSSASRSRLIVAASIGFLH